MDSLFSLTPNLVSGINLIISLVIGLALKDIATNLIQGLLFFLSSDFKRGDSVYIDGCPAIIVSIGLRKTIFRVDNGNKIVWRFVNNDRIKMLKMEKIIETQHEQEKDIERTIKKVLSEQPKGHSPGGFS